MKRFFGGHPSQEEFERLLQEYVEYRHQAEIDRLSDLYPLLYSNPKLGYTAQQVAQKVPQALRKTEAQLTALDAEFTKDIITILQTSKRRVFGFSYGTPLNLGHKST